MLVKFSGNPIITPTGSCWWEAYQTFNPGAILLNNKIHIVYRAIGVDKVSRFGYATSRDGFTIDERFSYPIYGRETCSASYRSYPSTSGGGFGGCEDPRLVKVKGDSNIYMTYNAFSSEELRVGITSIHVNDFLNKKWIWEKEKLISLPRKVNKNFVIFPEKIQGKYAILHSISPKISITYLDNLNFREGEYIESSHQITASPDGWEAEIKSPGAPPLKTEEGWLLFYHGISKKEICWKYKIGFMLLDLKKPEEIRYKAKQPVIEPNQWYENGGFKPGIVYTCGAVLKDKKLYVYYGGADNYVCVAYAWLDEFLKTIS